MLEKPKSMGERVVIVHMDIGARHTREQYEEFLQLVLSTGAVVAASITGMKSAPDPKYFVGSGKADEIRAAVLLEGATVVIFNHLLSPSQERNLEELIKARVVNRTALILDIFAQRARSFEGKLQVELAQLQHLSTRLVRGWTHLERQKGGIGLRGPGETQLETDRRLLRQRIKTIHKRLEKVRMQRENSRQARRRAAWPTVAIVGYTNAGKSTLFNRLTHAEVFTANQLFATLDPTLRRLDIPSLGPAIIADTVGFISDLPHDLVEAFRATLEETRDANLLLHVSDISSPNHKEQSKAVQEVLAEIGAQSVPQLFVYNKIDQIPECDPKINYDIDGKPSHIWVSAQTGLGIDLLIKAIGEHLYGDPIHRSILLTQEQGKLRAELYRLGAVKQERLDDQGHWLLTVCMRKADFHQLLGHEGPEPDPASATDGFSAMDADDAVDETDGPA